jgi:hypothetical protein
MASSPVLHDGRWNSIDEEALFERFFLSCAMKLSDVKIAKKLRAQDKKAPSLRQD